MRATKAAVVVLNSPHPPSGREARRRVPVLERIVDQQYTTGVNRIWAECRNGCRPHAGWRGWRPNLAIVGEKIAGRSSARGDYLFECRAVRRVAGREVEDERDTSGITETLHVTGEPTARKPIIRSNR
jgi:hypothetical protein